mgnify:CR=1 FL=1
MKNPLSILMITLIAFLTYGCAGHPPDSYKGASTNYDADYFDYNDTIEYKYAFRYLLPAKERLKLVNKLNNTKDNSDSWTKKMRSDGFNALTISAVGTNAFSSEGQAAGLALSVVDSFLEGRSEKRRFSYMVFSDEWLGGTFTDVEQVREVAKKKTLIKLKEVAKVFDYNIKCIANCDKNMATFELNSINQAKYKNQFHPEKLSLELYLTTPEKIDSDALERKIFSQDSNYQSKIWKIKLSGGDDAIEYKTVQSPDHIERTYNQASYVSANTNYNIHQTPLGRNFLRLISKKMPNWVYADTVDSYEVAILNGELYNPTQESSVKRFRGAKTVEYN